MGEIHCNHENMHMSKTILEKDKQGMTREFERTVDFLGNSFQIERLPKKL